jgi:hypothetical protein
MINLKLIGMAALGAGILAVTAYGAGRWDAMKACNNRHAKAQLEQNEKVRKTYEKIERKIPYSADRAARREWLLKHARK